MRRTILALVVSALVGAGCSKGAAPAAPPASLSPASLSAEPEAATPSTAAAGGVSGILRHVERTTYSHSRIREPLVAWTVQAVAQGGGPPAGSAETDARGAFTIHLTPGRYVLLAVHPGAVGLPEEAISVPAQGFTSVRLVWHTTSG